MTIAIFHSPSSSIAIQNLANLFYQRLLFPNQKKKMSIIMHSLLHYLRTLETSNHKNDSSMKVPPWKFLIKKQHQNFLHITISKAYPPSWINQAKNWNNPKFFLNGQKPLNKPKNSLHPCKEILMFFEKRTLMNSLALVDWSCVKLCIKGNKITHCENIDNSLQ